MTSSLRPRRVAALAVLAAVLVLGTVARAQESVNIIMPQGRQPVIAPDRGMGEPVRLTGVEAVITINDQVATTTLVMTIRNASRRPQEACVLLPVPQGAVVRSFQLDSLGSEPTAKLLPREEARKIYDEIVRRMKDPGILEFAGYNQIRSSVFPIPAGGEEKVRLTYEHLLAADGSAGAGVRVEYELPRSTAGEIAWTIGAEIKASQPIAAVYSATHDVNITRHGRSHLTVKATTQGANVGPVQIAYLLEKGDGDGMTASLIAYPDPEVGEGKGGYFMLLAALPDEAKERLKIKREVTIVIDRSGSMRGEKMVQAREAARQVVEGLEDGEAFNIIDFASDVQMFSARPVIKSAETIKEVRRYLESVTASGGTNIHDALLEALRQAPTDKMLPVVLFLTDGQATVGRTRERDIRDAATAANKHERRIFTFGVGNDVNAPLLSTLARESRAMSTFVMPQEDVEVKVGQVFRRLSGPVLASPVLTVLDADGKETTRLVRELQPPKLPDVFEGEQILVMGQYTAEGPVKFKIAGNFRGEERQFKFTLDTAGASTRHAYVPRLWANRKIAALIEEIRASGADRGPASTGGEPRTKELVDEIVRLSLKFGILTEYTAFLAIEPGAIDLEGLSMTPAAAAPAEAAQRLEASWAARVGEDAVMQQEALDVQRVSATAGGMNMQYSRQDGARSQRARQGVQHIGDRSLFLRGNRWVDGRLYMQEAEAPEVVIEFGTPEYERLVEKLSKENLQGLIANAGETYLLIEGQRVLVRGPGS